jgi:hypothetical protein
MNHIEPVSFPTDPGSGPTRERNALTVQSHNRLSYGLEHTVDLPISTLMKEQDNDFVAALFSPHALCSPQAVAQLDAVDQPPHLVVRNDFFCRRSVELVHPETRVHQPVSQSAIVGEYYDPGRVAIESTYRKDPFTTKRFRDQIHDCPPAAIVTDAGYRIPGFVQQDVYGFGGSN